MKQNAAKVIPMVAKGKLKLKPKAERGLYEVRPITHREDTRRYDGRCIVRAADLAIALEQAGLIRPGDRAKVRDAIVTAIEDGRTAGFAAGVAWAKSKA